MPAIERSITLGLALVGLAVLVGLGCANQSEKWIGEWRGTANRTIPGAPNDPISHAINTVIIDIHADKSFDFIDLGGIKKSGTATLGSDTAYLTIKRVLDRPIESLGSGAMKMNKDITLTFQEDGSITMKDPEGFDPAPIVLRRTSQP